MEILLKETLVSKFEEAEKSADILDILQQKLDFDDEFYARLMLTVSEAITNAIVHGNKLDPEKMVDVEVQKENDLLTFLISDEGDGFDPDNVKDPLLEENLLNTSGRGVFLMREYADEVEYLSNGTMLRLSFNLP